jgi:hypothetical protein
MLYQLINEYRAKNGRHNMPFDNYVENQNCFFHCVYMAQTGDVVNAPSYLLNGKKEAVAERVYFREYNEAVRAMIEEFDTDPLHREIMLFNFNLAGAFFIRRDVHSIYVCIRGW